MSKRAYQFDRNGFLIGTTVADESPMEPGVFLLPAGCTFKKPPASVPEGKIARWNGSAWKPANPPAAANENDPVAKLAAFLNANPDVAALLQSNDGGADV